MKYRLLTVLLLAGWIGPLGAETILRTEFQDTQPKFILQNGQFSGLCLELMALIEAKSEFRFTYPSVFVPVSRITEDLKAGLIDIYFGLAKTPQREKDFGFVGELFRTRYQLVARKGDPLVSLASVEELKASKAPILVIRGSAQANYYQKVLGLATEDAPTSVEVALRQLKVGNGALFGYYDLGVEWYLESLKYRDSLVALPLKLDEDGQWLCVGSTLPVETVSRLGQVLELVRKTPEWAAIMRKYFG